jgi:hypothetical protein
MTKSAKLPVKWSRNFLVGESESASQRVSKSASQRAGRLAAGKRRDWRGWAVLAVEVRCKCDETSAIVGELGAIREK